VFVEDKICRAKLMMVELHSCVTVFHFKQTVLSTTELNLMLCHAYKMDIQLPTQMPLEDQVAELFWVNVLSK
jgi:hypothetical protein